MGAYPGSYDQAVIGQARQVAALNGCEAKKAYFAAKNGPGDPSAADPYPAYAGLAQGVLEALLALSDRDRAELARLRDENEVLRDNVAHWQARVNELEEDRFRG